MQPKMCTKCKKNIAVVFITKMEAGVTLNEGYCLRCARSLGIPQIDQAVRQMGISEEDLDLLSDEMSNMFGQREESDGEDDEIDSQTATFPLLNQLFGGSGNLPAQPPRQPKEEAPKEETTTEDVETDNVDTVVPTFRGCGSSIAGIGAIIVAIFSSIGIFFRKREEN